MKKRNTVLTLLVCLSMLMTLLTACSGKEAATGQTPSGSASEDELYEITMAYPGSDPGDVALVQEEINKLIRDRIGATVKLLPISFGAWQQQLNLMLSANEKLDIMTVLGSEYGTRAAKGQLVALDDLLAKSGQDILKAVDPSYMNAVKIDGKTYAVPSIRDFAAGPGMLMRKDLVDKYKIDTGSIKSYEDLTPIFQTIKENEPGVTPLVPLGGGSTTLTITDLMDTSDFDTLDDSVGVLPDLDNGFKVVNLFENPKYQERLNLVRQWYLDGYISKDAATTSDSAETLMGAGKAFAYFCRIKPGIEAQEAVLTGHELVAVSFAEPVTQTSNITILMQGIAQNSKNPQKAMEFLNLLYSDSDLLNLLDYGIENKHYVKTSDTMIGYPEGVTAATSRYTNSAILFGNQYISYVFEGNEPDIWSKLAEFNGSAKQSKALGFTFNVEPVKTESAAVQNVINQFKGGLETGTLDPAEILPKFLDKLKAAGIDTIIAEKQKQLDAWAQNKQ
ncbi:ABC transporter substrate-binding protein [Paenibacillus sp. S150]|uniref:ABC transporter substrate-binding protein n=1 Tax=Paenibacillus sp. S150 TaxID=2749826 RepID=UPI001C598C05|nr:ABC transporter substrate-binding protein [Paenibacillus sp. S150]MBW4082518.1 ABC transporter substrate-binding protein [Paenibacillus sp. S150]